MYDTCDSDAWKKFMGEPSSPCRRIGLVGCTDGFQAHGCGTLSLKPLSFANFSLPPELRFKNEHMLLSMFLPINVKSFGQKKYYDFAARYELNDLYHKGVAGIKVKVFTTTLDTPGRHEFLGMCLTT